MREGACSYRVKWPENRFAIWNERTCQNHSKKLGKEGLKIEPWKTAMVTSHIWVDSCNETGLTEYDFSLLKTSQKLRGKVLSSNAKPINLSKLDLITKKKLYGIVLKRWTYKSGKIFDLWSIYHTVFFSSKIHTTSAFRVAKSFFPTFL